MVFKLVFIGIDPGAKGGWSIIREDGSIECKIWDDAKFIEDMRDLSMSNYKNCRCALEKVGSMPKQGVSSTWRFGQSYGFIIGVLSALEIPFQTVPPQTWKKSFGLIHQDKAKSIEVAQHLFPDVSFLASDRSRKPSDGMAESLLLACYAQRHF